MGLGSNMLLFPGFFTIWLHLNNNNKQAMKIVTIHVTLEFFCDEADVVYDAFDAKKAKQMGFNHCDLDGD